MIKRTEDEWKQEVGNKNLGDKRGEQIGQSQVKYTLLYH